MADDVSQQIEKALNDCESHGQKWEYKKGRSNRFMKPSVTSFSFSKVTC